VKEGALELIPLHTEFIKTVLTIFPKYVLAAAMSMMNAVMTHVQCVAHQLTVLFQWMILWTILWTIRLDSEGSEGSAEVDSVDLVDLVDLADADLVTLMTSVDVDSDFFHFSRFSHSSLSITIDGFEKE
jgi:hypothetical protein